MGGSAGYQAFMLYVPATDRYVSGFINVMGDIGAVLVPIIGRVSTR
jgi:D-alanyl-D-alanine carboxypeptidase